MSFFGGSNKKTRQQAEEIQSLTEEVNLLRISESSFKATISENERSKEALEEEIGKLRKENKEMKDKLEPYDQMFNERQDLQKKDVESTIKIKELNSEIKELNQKIETQNVEMKELNQTIETRNDELKRTKKELHSVMGEYDADKSKMNELFQEREGLDSKIDELENEKCELEDQVIKLKEDIQKKATEEEERLKTAEEKNKDEKYAKAYLEDLRKELGENKAKVDALTLESEALKSENESLFRANESKKKDMDEILGELTSIRNELKIEQQRFVKLKEDWDEEKKRTEFVIVSKSAGKTRKNQPTRPKDEDDSEDEHLVSVTEAARAEAEALREKERGLRKRINQLQIDKEELFRSGTNLFAENKSLKNKYDDVCNERNSLLQSESTLQHKLREKEKEIKDMKKTVDDLYYQNLAIKSNEENESKRNAYVVLMGNETVKQLEREKSALNRRVKFLERENYEIEQRVVELEKQSDALIKYSKKYDKHTPFPPLKGPFDLNLGESVGSTRTRPTSRERGHSYSRTASRERDRYSRTASEQPRVERPWSNQRRKEDDATRRSTYRTPSNRQRAQHDYRTDMRPPEPRPRSPAQFKDIAPPFVHQSSRQPSFAPSNQSHTSRFSLPPMQNTFDTQRLDTRSDRRTSRRNSPIIN